jgi:hypothetical protein
LFPPSGSAEMGTSYLLQPEGHLIFYDFLKVNEMDNLRAEIRKCSPNFFDHQIKEDEMGGYIARIGERRNACKILV